MATWWVPLVTFFAGQMSLILLELWRSHRASKESASTRRNEFQRSTLLELQEELNAFIAAINTQAMVLRSSEHGAYDVEAERTAIADLWAADARMYKLRVRVDSDEIRETVGHVRNFATAEHAGRRAALENFELARERYRTSMDLIGEALRLL